MKIIAYTYEADVHCPDCAGHHAAVGLLRRTPPLSMGVDVHGLAYDLVDREGNPVQPVFGTDEHDFTHCSDCREEISA